MDKAVVIAEIARAKYYYDAIQTEILKDTPDFDIVTSLMVNNAASYFRIVYETEITNEVYQTAYRLHLSSLPVPS